MQSAISRFLRYLLVERNASALTIKSYREDLTALDEYLTESYGRPAEPAEITSLDLRGYVAALHEAGYAKTSIARRLASLRSFFRFAQREGYAAANPAKPLRNPAAGPEAAAFPVDRRDRPAAGNSARRISRMGLRDRAILETTYSAGLRVSELVGINDGDLDLAGGLVRIRGKGRRERLAPLGSFALQALQRWLSVRPLSRREPPGPRPGVRQPVGPPADDAERRRGCWKNT